ncbi:MAG: hypothetical protein E6J89_06080 [Deltaproteobacteria bacterium]|nr:MAG: hypothetical protein E6J89_06080 [Deltaproteobacteria bacterium]
MKEINLGEVIEGVISKFCRNRTGPRPRLLAKIPPNLPYLSWQDDGLERFIKHFLYHTLLMNDPETPVQVIVHERTSLADLEDFVGVYPAYWIQLRIQGHGSGMIESVVEEVFSDLGYRCEEWIGVEGSSAQLAIFSPLDREEPKMVFCVDTVKGIWKCDFLIPVSDRLFLPSFSSPRKKY